LRGHHATAGLVEVIAPSGKRSEFVLRAPLQEAEDYLELARTYPLVRDSVPNLLGVINGWAILEKLQGIENKMVAKKIQEYSEFTSRYIQNAADLVVQSAEQGLMMTDVVFKNGHNVMVNENTAEIQFVEQTMLQPKERFYGDPSKERLIGEQLCKEYMGLVRREWADYDTPNRKIVPQFAPDGNPLFVFELTKAIAAKIPLESLLGREMGITDYKFAPDLIKAVQEDDFNQFQSILLRDDGGSPTHLVYTGKPIPRKEL
jgi:hypothetical protein